MAAIKLARYKFVARMLSPDDEVVDLGCGKGYGSYFFSRYAKSVVGVDHSDDFAPRVLGAAGDKLRLVAGDLLDLPAEISSRRFSAVVSLDVIEHFDKPDGERIVRWCAEHLADGGMLLLGTPSRFSQPFRSAHSRAQHIHEYEPDEIEALVKTCFRRTFLFSMNDEVVHTGFRKLAWFVFVIGLTPRS